MRVNERMKKLLSIVLTLCMVLSYIPAPAYAVGTDCTHHTKHTAECGYVEAVAGVPCAHVHDENCGYVEAVAEVLCACEATDENGAIVHTEGCGYVAPVTGAECTHVHDDACGYVAAVEGHECHYECAECAIAPANEEPGDETPVCSCTVKCGETADTNCAVCSAAGADLTACIGEEQEEPPVAATNNIDAAAMTAEELKAAVDAALAAGYTAITVNLAEDADTEMFTALRTALAESTAPDGSINLTISGAKTVPDEGFIDMLDYFDNGEKNIAGDKLKSLTLTDVETIGEYAFSACTNLEAVNMPKVVTIGEYAFNEWKKGTKLTSLDLPNATTIGVSAFAYSSLLTSVNLPKVTSIGEFAFGYCDLRTLDLPEVTTIDGEAFFNNDNLVSCSAPKATTIGFYPWGNCSRLETLELTAAGDFTLSNNLFANTPTGQINLVLHKDKESQVTQNADGTATWKTTNSNGGKLEYTFKSITFVYSIEVSAIENGAVTADKSTATEGETVTLTVTAAEGYILDTLTVMNGDTPVEVTGNSFTMPAGDVTVSATFKACDHSGGAHTSATDLGDGTHSFTCSVCGTSVTEPHSIGADGKCVCGLAFWTVEGNTLTIDGTLGGKTTATEEDLAAMVELLRSYIESGNTTIIVTGNNQAKLLTDGYLIPVVSLAFEQLTYVYQDENIDSYWGTVDLIYQDVTEIVEYEFYVCDVLRSITLPKVTKVGDRGFWACYYLETLTFGSVVTDITDNSGEVFYDLGYNIGGCNLVLNCGQLNTATEYQPNLDTRIWWNTEWKSITLTHSYGDWASNGDGTHTRTCAIDPAHTESGDCSGGTATCTTLAVCDLCGTEYGEVGGHTAEPTYALNAEDSTKHDVTYSCCGATVAEAHTMDITTGKCGACGADMTVVATVTDGSTTLSASDAATLNQAVTAILETGSRTFTVELLADASAEMIIAIRRAICDTEGVADGSIHLTLKGVTSIPGTTNWDGVAFGPGDVYDEAGEIVDQELVTQLASINLPDVTEIGAQAFYFCENLVSVSAPKAQTIGAQAFGYTALTSVEFPELTTIPTDMFSGTWTLSSAKFPKVTTIEQGGLLVGAKFTPENNPTPFPLELTAEGDITFNGSNHFNIKSQNYSGKVDLVLCCDKADKVTKNEDGTATWQVRDDLSYTFKSITFKHSYVDGKCTACGEDCAHTGGTATCKDKAVCDICKTAYGELGGHTYNTAGSCTVCGAACTHSSFADGKCTACGITGGYCGDVIWTYDEVTKAFAITGTGAMEDYNSYPDRPWDGSISKNATSVTISEGVTRIGERAFQNFRQITAVTVPASVESIGYCAFTGCKAMQSITFAEDSRLTAFDYYVFQNCTALKQITLPAGVTSVDTFVFSGCNALTDIFVEEGSTTLKDIDGVLYTADGTTLLRYPSGKDDTAFTTPAGVTTIGEGAFEDNVNLETITLSEGVTTIGMHAFWLMESLTTVTIPSSVTSIDYAAFESCDKLTTINAPCNWDTEDPLYTFDSTVAVIVGDHTPNADGYTVNENGTHTATCSKCGYAVTEEHTLLTCSANGNVITGSCSKCPAVDTATITAENTTYNGTAQETATVAYSAGWKGGELTVSYVNNVNAGTATASITIGEATASVEFTIAKAEVNLDTLVDPEFATGLVYNGTAQALVIKTGSVEGGTIVYSLNLDGEYTATIPTATETGRYGVYWRIEGDENHYWEGTSGVTQVYIDAVNVTNENATITLEYTSIQFSGTANTPDVTSVVVDGVTLTAGKDYDVSYENNVYAGTAKAVITFKGNYSGTATETFQISKAPLTVTADDKSMTTGRDLPAFTYTITGFVNGETEAVLTTKPTVRCETDGKTAGEYAITVSGAEAANYDITHVNGTLSVVDHQHAWTYTADGDTITAKCGNADTCPDAEQTIKIAAEGKTYDGTPVTATLTGNIDGVDTPAIRYFKNGVELNESVINAGTYTASITLGEATASVEFTIAKAEIDGSTLINPEFAEGLIYNGTAQALVTKIGSVDGGYIVYSLSIDGEYTTTIPVATEAGTYRVYWTIECDENHYVDGTPGSSRVTIAAKAITVTADAVSKTYGDTDPTLTYKVEGLVNGDELTGELKRVAGENVGSYAIEQNTLTAGNNYSITYTGANLTINAKAITEADVELNGSLTYTGEEQTQPITVTEGITYEVTGNKATNAGAYELTVKGTGNYTGEVKLNWSIKEAAAVVGKAPTAKELTYTGTAQALVNAGTTADGKLVYSLSENGEFTESIPTGTNAGEYTVWYYVQGDDNHSDTAKASVKVTIAKADPVIGTVGCEMALFDSIAISNVELTRTDMSVEGTLVLTDSELTAGEGTYNWKFTPKDTDNYNTITGTVVLNVTADVLEKIEANGNLEKDSYSYGDTFSIDGLTVTATYTTGATKDVTELVSFDSTLAVGQTSVELTYQGKTCTVTGFTVAKKQLVIDRMAWDIPENAVYNGTEYTATLNGTLPTGVVVTLSGDKATNAGSYTAKAVFSLAEGYSADNYEIVNGEDLTADWTIAKKNIDGAQITLGTALTYNGKQQTQTVTKVEIEGLTVTYTVFGNTGTDAKGYTLTVTGNGNFEGTATADWIIAKRNISGATITLGDSLTYNGDAQTQEVIEVKIGDLTVTYDVTANKQLGAGNYTLTVIGNGNFEGSATADWSIAKAKLTITANNNSITYGDVPAANGVTGTGFVSSESIEDLSGELTCSYNYEQFGNVGTYKITPSGVTSNNYEITFADGTLTVNAKAITVTADAVSKTYGEADPALTYKVEGLVNGDELTGKLKRVAGENVGSYAIEQNTLTAGNNYSITYTGANLTINAKAITEADVELNGSLTYTGKEQTQPITVTEGITYEVTGNKATNVGTYELTVKGTGNYTGSVTLDWTIAKAKLTITADSKVIYIGEKVPTLTYTASGLVGGDKLTKEPVLTTNADADQAGSYTITAANADAGDNYTITYVSGSLTIMDKETEVETKIEQTELTEVPEGLKDTQFDTVEEIKEELISKILATSTGYSAENMVHYDVALHFSLDGGDSWILATEENFPTEGITVILPYPEGTNARDYEFVVSHMFTVTSQRLGTVAGEVEMPKVEETANGIRVTLNGLSPVTVAARYHDHTGGIATCTDKAICSICGTAYGELDATNHAGGTEVKNAKEATCGAEGYTGDTYCKGCNEVVEKGTTIKATGEHTYGDWKVVKEPTKTTKGEKQRTCSVCGHVDSKEIPVLSDTPATGDDSNIMLYSSMFTVSLAGLVVLLLAAKKRKQENA